MGHLSPYFLGNAPRSPTILHFWMGHYVLAHLPSRLDLAKRGSYNKQCGII